jgi:Holliday junction resolvase RusA-like endonuclease
MIVVELDGDPVAKGRPRFTSKGGPHTYTPAKTAAYEQALGYMALQAMRGKKPLDGPLRVRVTAYLRVPKSWSIKERQAALVGTIRPTSKPDYDNILKIGCDALNKIVWHDDAQIVWAEAFKLYSTRPRLRIEIIPLTANPALIDYGPLFDKATVDSITDSR